MILFLLFIITSLLFGSYQVGPTTVRVYSTILLILYIIFKKNLNKDKLQLPYKYIWIYLVFIFVSLLVKVFVDPAIIDTFIKNIFGFYLVAIISYVAVDFFVKKQSDIKKIVTVLTIIGVFNAWVSILQAMGNPLGFSLGSFFSTVSDTYLAKTIDMLEVNGYDMADVVVPGIFGHGATNGIMNSMLGILPLYFLSDKNKFMRVVGLFSTLYILIGGFYIQERSGFGLLIVANLYALWKLFPHKYIILICLILFCMYIFGGNINFDRLGRISDFEYGDVRGDLMSNAHEFIGDHLLFGGETLYTQQYGMTPHNFILHSLIFSGLIGSVIIIPLFIMMVIKSIRYIFASNFVISIYIFACATLIYHLNSLFHSNSLIIGDNILWLVFALLLRSVQINKI